MSKLNTLIHCSHTIRTVFIHCISSFRTLEARPHLMWFDNFSKLFARTMPDISNGVVSQCLWTGVALMEWKGDADLTLNRVHYGNGEYMSASPPRLFTAYFDRCCIEAVIELDGAGMFYLDNSICVQYNVNNVPCKPVVDAEEEPELADWLSKRSDGMRNCHPKKLIKKNIGSTRGMLQIMRTYMFEIEATRPQKYGVILADIDIFCAIQKVIYNILSITRIWDMFYYHAVHMLI